MNGPFSFFDIYGWPLFNFEGYGWPFLSKKAIFEKKWRKNRQSEIGPFWLISKLMNGPLSFFDIYGWPPFVFEAYGWPFWRLGAIQKRKNTKNALVLNLKLTLHCKYLQRNYKLFQVFFDEN